MIFADDSDLERVQPSVFGYGVASFEELHEVAGDEVVRDCRMYWLSTLPVLAPVASSFFEQPKETADTINTRANNVFIFILLKYR